MILNTMIISVVLLLGIQIVHGETLTDETMTIEKLDDIASFSISSYNLIVHFDEIKNDRTISSCEKYPVLIEFFNNLLIFEMKYDIKLTQTPTIDMLHWIGIAYLLDCSTYDYQKNTNMMKLFVQYNTYKEKYDDVNPTPLQDEGKQ